MRINIPLYEMKTKSRFQSITTAKNHNLTTSIHSKTNWFKISKIIGTKCPEQTRVGSIELS